MNCNIQDYIDYVRSGDIEVCQEQLQLCELVEKAFREEDLYVDEEQLEKYLSYQKYFPFDLLPWERFCFALHNCTYNDQGQLRWPDLVIYVGRGSGKNGYGAFESFCLLTPVNGVEEYNIDIYAMSEDQAMTSFNDVYNVLEKNSEKMKRHFQWTKTCITNTKTKSKLRYRTSNYSTKDGGRPGMNIFDEIHAYQNSDIINVAEGGLGKKRFPRNLKITSNGDVREGPLDKMLEDAHAVLCGEEPDNGTLYFICHIESDDEIDDPDMWTKAIPSLLAMPNLRLEMNRAYWKYKKDPIQNAAFVTKRLNRPKGDKENEVTSWDNILATNQHVDLEFLRGRPCVAGIDYAQTTDFVAVTLLFIVDGIHYQIKHSWVCRQCNDLGRIKAPLEAWAQQGLLTWVDGPEIPPDVPAAWIKGQGSIYNIRAVGIDKYRYTLLAKALTDVGYIWDKDPKKSMIFLTRPEQEMQIGPTITSLFVNHAIAAGDDPLWRWYVNNSKQIMSKAGNITYGKIEPKSRKTDGFKAWVASEIAELRLCEVGRSIEQTSKKKSTAFPGVYTY